MRPKRKIFILTVFPDYFDAFLKNGVVAQALSGQRGSLDFEVQIINLRDYGLGRYKSVDDYSYGGGPGMVMRPDVLERSLKEGIWSQGYTKEQLHVVRPGPKGHVWNNSYCKDYSVKFIQSSKEFVFICGRYEGIDQRFIDQYVDEEISLGDYVLTGGELAVMAILDSSLRFVQETLGNQDSVHEDSFEGHLLDHPHYTRPPEFNDHKLPEVLLSGHHQNINLWRQKQRMELTSQLRPDLYEQFLKAQKDKFK